MEELVYPHTHAIEAELKNLPKDFSVSPQCLYDMAIEMVQEYEHGSADIQLLGIETIEQYVNVIVDYLLFVSNGDHNEKTNHCRCHG